MEDVNFEIIDSKGIPFSDDVFNPKNPSTPEPPVIKEGDGQTPQKVLSETNKKEEPVVPQEEIEKAFLNDGKPDKEPAKKESTKEETPSEDKSEEGEGNENFRVFHKDLVDLGLLDEDKEYDGTAEGLVDAFRRRDERSKKDIYKQVGEELGEDGMALIQHLRNGGRPEDWVDTYSDPLEGVNIEDKEHQKAVVKHYYRGQGWSEDEINQELMDIEDLGDEKLADKSKKMFERLKKQHEEDKAEFNKQAAEQEATVERQREEFRSNINKLIDEKSDIFGISLPKDPKSKQELKDYILKPKVRLPDGRMVTEAYANRVKTANDLNVYLLLSVMAKNGYNFDSIKRAEGTKATLGIKQQLEQSRKQSTVPGKLGTEETRDSAPVVGSNFDWADLFGTNKKK